MCVRRGMYTSDPEAHPQTQSQTPPREQNDGQTGVKTLPSRKLVCGRYEKTEKEKKSFNSTNFYNYWIGYAG